MDPDLADLIPGFLEHRRKDIAAMLTALDRGDFETVRILGHSMKGAAAGYGFDAITDIGAVDYIKKPIQKEILLMRVDRACRRPAVKGRAANGEHHSNESGE